MLLKFKKLTKADLVVFFLTDVLRTVDLIERDRVLSLSLGLQVTACILEASFTLQ